MQKEMGSIPVRYHFSWLKNPEWVFVIIALLSGSVLCLLIPPQAGFDEITHLARIWEISGGYLVPNQRFSQGPYLPTAFLDISYRNQFFFDPVRPNFIANYMWERIDQRFLTYQTQSSYLPTPYLPQAFAVGLLGRILDAPVLLIFYACRALYLLGYVLLTFLAIRIIPFGKWLLTVLALAPIAVLQSSSISPDAYTNGASFLFIAWVLMLTVQEKRVSWKQLWITISITALLLMVKLNGAFLLPLLLLLVWKGFDSKKILPILAGATIILFSVFVIGWNIVAYSTFFLKTPDISASGQVIYILSHPFEFGVTLFHDFATHGLIYLREWVALYGFGATLVPPVTFPLFGLLLVAAWLFSPSPRAINARVRALLILTGIFGCFCMFMVIYLTFNTIGATSIVNLQGRHFTPILPVLLLGLVPGRKLFSRLADWFVPVAIGVGTLLTLAIYILGAYLSYYVVCGTSLYSPGLCYQPQYKNWAPNDHSTQPVAQGVLLQQTFTAVCAPLQSVRVWRAPAAQGSTGETLITLKDAGNGAVLAEDLVNNQIAADHAWLEMAFPPIDNAVGKQFVIEITSDVSDPAAGLSFGVSARREYLDGIVINNVSADYDLIFQYGCEPLKVINVIK
jgi:uncharacterized membrane protein